MKEKKEIIARTEYPLDIFVFGHSQHSPLSLFQYFSVQTEQTIPVEPFLHTPPLKHALAHGQGYTFLAEEDGPLQNPGLTQGMNLRCPGQSLGQLVTVSSISHL